MTLEEDLFRSFRPLGHKLEAYGFLPEADAYVLKTPFFDGSFRAEITVNKRHVSGRVIDEASGEDYVQIRLPGAGGPFASAVKEAYLALLEDIAASCFERLPFFTDQANRVASLIKETYGDTPEHTFRKYPDYAVFRESQSGKWYAVIMRVEENTLEKGSPECEILDLKASPQDIPSLLCREGIRPGWHMDAKHWVTVILDDTLPDEEIMTLVQNSHSLIGGKKGKAGIWLVPANPAFYDLAAAFRNSGGTTLWKQSTAVKPGDTVYMYVGKPYSAILYQTEAVETDIPSPYRDTHIRMDTLMRLRLTHEYAPDLFPLSSLVQYGVKTVRGPRSVPDALLEKLEEAARK